MAATKKKKIPLIERDATPITPEDIATEIEKFLTTAVNYKVAIEAYQITFKGGVTIAWSKKNGT